MYVLHVLRDRVRRKQILLEKRERVRRVDASSVSFGERLSAYAPPSHPGSLQYVSGQLMNDGSKTQSQKLKGRQGHRLLLLPNAILAAVSDKQASVKPETRTHTEAGREEERERALGKQGIRSMIDCSGTHVEAGLNSSLASVAANGHRHSHTDTQHGTQRHELRRKHAACGPAISGDMATACLCVPVCVAELFSRSREAERNRRQN